MHKGKLSPLMFRNRQASYVRPHHSLNSLHFGAMNPLDVYRRVFGAISMDSQSELAVSKGNGQTLLLTRGPTTLHLLPWLGCAEHA